MNKRFETWNIRANRFFVGRSRLVLFTVLPLMALVGCTCSVGVSKKLGPYA